MGGRGKGAATFLVRKPWIPIILVGVVIFTIWVIGTRNQPHNLRAGFTSALQLFPGLDVRVDGIDAGKIGEIDFEDGVAIVNLGIEDEAIWPLPEGTRAVARWGTTVGNGTRFIELIPGPEGAPELPENGIIPSDQTTTAVEFDDLFNTFDGRTRERMQGFLDNTKRTLHQDFQRWVDAAPPALDATAGVFDELARDQLALDQLVRDTSQTAAVLGRSDDQIRDLVDGAAGTFNEFGVNSVALRQSIAEFPETLRESRTTLARLDTSVDELDLLLADLGPGARELRPLARQARPALSELRDVTPQALSTIRTARAAGPDITQLLRTGVPFSGKVDETFSELAPMIGCLRPYAPELAGFFSNWASFGQNYDSVAHYARVRVQFGVNQISAQPESIRSDDYVDLIDSIGGRPSYAYGRPPGLGDGQPQFIEACNYTPDLLDPSKDLEDRPGFG